MAQQLGSQWASASPKFLTVAQQSRGPSALSIGQSILYLLSQADRRGGKRAGVMRSSIVRTFSVQSEVGRLRQAIVHQPELELSRLTPENSSEPLVDDVQWARRAKEEHDGFAEALREKGVEVHYYGGLLAGVLEIRDGRDFVLDRICTPEMLGPPLVAPLRKLLEALEAEVLATYFAGEVLKADLHPMRAKSLKRDSLRAGGPPLLGAAPEPPVPTRQLLPDLSRGVDQPDGEASSSARDIAQPGDPSLSPAVRWCGLRDVPRRRRREEEGVRPSPRRRETIMVTNLAMIGG